MHWELKPKTEQLISNFPIDVNKYRNGVDEALELMKRNNLMKNISVKVITQNTNFLKNEARCELDKILIDRKGTFLVTAIPYTFVLSFINEQWVVVENHFIDSNLGGNK